MTSATKSRLVERLLLAVLAWSLAFHPAFALRVSCSAVGALFPERCCCAPAEAPHARAEAPRARADAPRARAEAPRATAEAPLAAPRPCCAERAEADERAPSVRPSKDCRCAIDLPDREPATPEALARGTLSRELALDVLAAACADADATRAFDVVIEHDPPRGDCDPPPRGSSDRSIHLVASGMRAHLARLGVARC